MEKLKPLRTEQPIPSIKYLDSQIQKLLDPQITKERWAELEQVLGSSAGLLPNITFRLLSIEGKTEYTEEQKQRIFQLVLTSWASGKVARGIKMYKINEETKLWEFTEPTQAQPGREPLTRIELGSMILLGLSLKNKNDLIDQIIQTYNKLTLNKQRTLRDHIMNNLITTGNAFRKWVQANELDLSNGFEWDREVPRLGLKLNPQDRLLPINQEMPNKLPREFKHLDLIQYSLLVLAEFADYILTIPTITNTMRSDINIFQLNLATRLINSDPHDNPDLYAELQQKLKGLKSRIGQ